ncbi:AMP-binding protein [Saccharopolyspora erythraea]|uniref:AMP-binding protein n=1 Tax=Saccharopolyspora erythraea TaxID=1836 RepID=UPI001BAA9C76|nr:AMP-binding protein [Saccharopolyspora erythraea]QUH03135.1 AMP-binding protein [Saccharopolyspora erythraea]
MHADQPKPPGAPVHQGTPGHPDTSVPQNTPFVVRLAELAAAEPDRLALTCDDVSLTRSGLESASNRLARDLLARGVRHGDFVSIVVPNSVAFVVAELAAWKAGAVPQPLSPKLPASELREIIDLTEPALVIGDVTADVAGGRARLPADHQPDPALDDGPLPVVVSPAWKAPTSGGSTGRPKVIVAGRPALVEETDLSADVFGIEHGGVVLVPSPVSHNAPNMSVAMGLLRGNHVVLMRRFDARQVLHLVERHRVSWLYVVSTTMGRIMRLPEDVRAAADLSSLRTVFHTAAPVPVWLKRAWIDWVGPIVRELYAGTEAQATTVITAPEWLAHPGSVGRVLRGEMQIRDSDGRVLPPGREGKVWMRRAPDVEPTYRLLGAQAHADADGWESLGDIGWFDEDGYLYLGDREADMILVGGANVYPAEIEAALGQHDAVVDSCVVGLPDDDLGNVPHAIVVTRRSVSKADLVRHLRSRLAPYRMPRSFEFVTTPLRDDAGKIRRSQLRAARLAGRVRPAAGPATP